MGDEGGGLVAGSPERGTFKEVPPSLARPFTAADDGVAARLLPVLVTDDGGRGLADDPSISRFSRIDSPMVDLLPLVDAAGDRDVMMRTKY